MRWLFFQTDGFASGIEFDNAIPFRVLNRVGEDGCAVGLFPGGLQQGGKVVAIEDVVTQYERTRRTIQKFFTNQKSLR